MPCHAKKANRKKRGNVTAGHGRIGKHRKHPSGRGNAGGQHHMRIWFDKFHPGYFGKVGMRTYGAWKKGNDYQTITNVGELWHLAGEQAYTDAKDRVTKQDKKALVLDLSHKGYDKVLGKGVLPKIPIIVRARFFSKSAERKIREAGGICELRA
jgi:large subunit ribosomal protein L27Ae